jgi:predicted DNA-binding transcriptional regulator AlpA
MKLEDSTPEQRTPSAAVHKYVSLSKWVNERFPAWEQLLSAHDVARLTRRPRWVLVGMTMLRQFPRKRRFHGRGIGWLRADVLEWMQRDLHTTQCHNNPAPVARSGTGRQGTLPLGQTHLSSSSRKGIGPCMHSRKPHTLTRSSPR